MEANHPNPIELSWILACCTAKRLLNRAHAYKSAVEENHSAGRNADGEVMDIRRRIARILEKGALQARKTARRTLSRVRRAIGIDGKREIQPTRNR